MLDIKSNNQAVAEILDFYLQSSINTRLRQDIETLKSRLFEAEQALDSDAILAESIKQAETSCSRLISTWACRAANRTQSCPGSCCKIP